MGSEIGYSTSDVVEKLEKEYRGYSFFQLLQVLQRLYPDNSEIGGLGPVQKEKIRFKAHASLAFPVADVQSLEFKKDRVDIEVNFLGIVGPSTPLPLYYTENILFSDEKENAIQCFLDFFHHRMISLFYRTWQKYRYMVRYQKGATDSVSNYLYSLLGVGAKEFREFSNVRWNRLLPFVGLLAMKSRSERTLRTVLSYYFEDIPIELIECTGRMATIDMSQRSQLGLVNTMLGTTASLGPKVFDRSSSYKLVLGPLDFEHYRNFLPFGKYHEELRELVKFVVSDQYAFDIELKLKGGQIPLLTLHNDNPLQLGCSAWLGERIDEEAVTTQVGYA